MRSSSRSPATVPDPVRGSYRRFSGLFRPTSASTAGHPTTSTFGRIQRWDLVGDINSAIPGTTQVLDFSAGDPFGYAPYLPFLDVDADGDAWAGRLARQSLFHVDGDTSTPSAPFSPAGFLLTGLAARPDTNEVWAVYGDPLGQQPAVIHVFEGNLVAPAAPVPIASIDLPPIYAALQIAWVGRDELWLHTVERGLLLLDAFELRANEDFDAAIRLALPVPAQPGAYSFVGRLIGDRATGDAWFSNFQLGEGYRASTDGRLDVFTDYLLPASVDDEGALWSYRLNLDGTISRVRGFSVADDLTVYETPFVAGFDGDSEVETGALWTTTNTPSQLLRMAEDGVITRTISRVIVDGVEVPLPGLRQMSVLRDGTAAIALERIPSVSSPGPGFLLDLTSDPPVATPMLTADEAIAVRNGILDASAAEQSDPFAWSVFGDTANVANNTAATVVIVRPNLPPEPVYTFPAGELALNGVPVFRTSPSYG